MCLLVTILAFFYIPFNTVTSIYSMNTQEINGVGHPIWLFSVTAVCVVLLSVMSWALTLQFQEIQHYRKWRKSKKGGWDGSPPCCKHSIGVHVLLIVYLLKDTTAPAMWILRSGVLVNTLSSSNKSPGACYNDTGSRQRGHMSACNFIELMTREDLGSKYSTRREWHITWRPGYTPWRSGDQQPTHEGVHD